MAKGQYIVQYLLRISILAIISTFAFFLRNPFSIDRFGAKLQLPNIGLATKSLRILSLGDNPTVENGRFDMKETRLKMEFHILSSVIVYRFFVRYQMTAYQPRIILQDGKKTEKVRQIREATVLMYLIFGVTSFLKQQHLFSKARDSVRSVALSARGSRAPGRT